MQIPGGEPLREPVVTQPAWKTTLRALSTGDGPVTRVDGAPGRRLALIEKDDQLRATFYRNSLIHTVLLKSICEVAPCPLRSGGRAGGRPVEAFWAATDRLQDLLKFNSISGPGGVPTARGCRDGLGRARLAGADRRT